jgi:integrase
MMTIEVWCDCFLAGHDYADGTVALYRRTLRLLTAGFGNNIRIDEVTPWMAGQWRRQLVAGRIRGLRGKPKPGTVAQIVRQARNLFEEARQDQYIPTNPFRHLCARAPVVEKNWRYVDIATFYQMSYACTAEEITLLALCRLGGLRRGEALAARWRDVNFSTDRLTVNADTEQRTTKKHKRQIPMSRRLRDILSARAHDIAQTIDEDAPGSGFPDNDRLTGNLWRRSLHRTFRAVCNRAGIQPFPFPFHTLRKCQERDWLEQFPLGVVADWMGHSPAAALRYYIRAEDRDFEKARY